MGVTWKGFELPRQVTWDEHALTETYGKFMAEPFERGYGATLGNAFRRVLLSSIEGAAVTSVKIEGVLHEFSSIPGVLEDVPQMILNIKALVLRSHAKGPKIISIKAGKKGEVTAEDIETDDLIEIVNPDLHLATLTKDAKFVIDLEVGKGRGYVPADRNKREGQPIGVIPIDSIFTPVRKVNFHIENTRVGQMTDYDRLILEIWTNGAVSPSDALLHGANILQRHLEVFLNLGQLPEEEAAEEKKKEADRELVEKFKIPISDLELSVRSSNCLKKAGIKTIGDLIQKAEPEMLKYRNFGKKSLAEIVAILTGMGLQLGMKMPETSQEASQEVLRSN